MVEGVYTAYTPFLFERSVIVSKKMLKNIFVIVGTMVLSLATVPTSLWSLVLH